VDLGALRFLPLLLESIGLAAGRFHLRLLLGSPVLCLALKPGQRLETPTCSSAHNSRRYVHPLAGDSGLIGVGHYDGKPTSSSSPGRKMLINRFVTLGSGA
jgi:hypothetical protein